MSNNYSQLKNILILLAVIGLGFGGYLAFDDTQTTSNPASAITPLLQNTVSSAEPTPEFTDDNTNETVIIKSDQEHYAGDREVDKV